jgi:small multidrug resistance pump
MPTLTYLWLFLAICSEVVATTCLRLSEGFTRPLPAAITVIGYGVSFYLLSLTLRFIPVGVVYAIWSGTGIVLIALIGWVFLKQALDLPALAGMGLILAGVLVINLFSRTVGH